MNLRHSLHVFVGTILTLLLAMSVLPQAGTTSLHGVALDKSGASIEGAKISIVNTSQGIQREATSSSSGEFEFLALPPGTYALNAEKDGFKRYEQTGIQLLVNVPTSVRVLLQVGSFATQVEVSAETQTINTTDASLGTAFSENQVKQLPLESRNVPDLLSLQAGVVYTGNRPDVNANEDTRSGSVNGSHSDQSNVTLDGIPVNEKGGYSFAFVLPVTLDSGQEFGFTTR